MFCMSRRAACAAALAAVTASAGCASTAGTPAASGVLAGIVLTGPTCPVQREHSPCPPAPLPGATVTVSAHGRIVARVRADHAGRLRVVLPAGRYRVQTVAPGPLESTAARSITVTAGAGGTHVRLIVDSGIR